MKVLCVFKLCVLVSVFAQTLTGPSLEKKIVCYFLLSFWAEYTPELRKYNIEAIPPALCTHIVYAFAGLDEKTNTIISLDPWQDLKENLGKAGYKRIVALKQKNPNLKVTLAIGDPTEETDSSQSKKFTNRASESKSNKFSNMASDPESRATFINSALEILNKHKFDGLDMNWGVKPHDKENFVQLLKELSEALKPQGYILTVTINCITGVMEEAYDLPKLSQYVDLMHFMCYFTQHGVVHANVPLKAVDGDILNVAFSVDYLLSQGVPLHKVILALPIYGRTFLLENPRVEVIEFGSTPAKEVRYTSPNTDVGLDGIITYEGVCQEVRNEFSQWKYHWHEQSATPYLRDGARIITYENGRSLANQVKLAVNEGLGGVVVWSIDNDDFRGDCNESDAYVDFVERHQNMIKEPVLKKALENLSIPEVNQVNLSGPSYVLKDGQLHLHLPQAKFSNYALMQAINVAMALSVEEKRIEDEIAKFPAGNEIDVSIEGNSTSIHRVFTVAAWSKYNERRRLPVNISLSFY